MKNTKTLTFHSAHNYGAVLQSIGLQQFLLNSGYNNEIINYDERKIIDEYNPLNFKNLDFKTKIKKAIKYIIYGKKLKKRYKKFINFIENEVILSKKVYDIKDIINYIKDDDILIVGSDQIWNPEILSGISDIYTLNFKNLCNKKISYAASIGNSKIKDEYIDEYRMKVQPIDKISVREITAKNELSKIMPNKSIEVTLDPTMLLTKEQWEEKLINYENEEKEKYILAYTMEINNEYIKIVNYLSKITGLRIIYFDYRNLGFNNILRNAYTDNPYEFLKLIKDAEYIVTNSFHGTVFSIIFNKKFWIVPHRTNGSRMIDLLNKLKLEKRLVSTLEEFKLKNYDEKINFSKVEEILNKERNKSSKWLINSINS